MIGLPAWIHHPLPELIYCVHVVLCLEQEACHSQGGHKLAVPICFLSPGTAYVICACGVACECLVLGVKKLTGGSSGMHQ
jgi:hypothetical protein